MRLALERRTRLPRVPGWAIAIIIAWLSGVALLAMLARVHGTPQVPCHFRAATGVPCATCGSSRAGIAALEGRVIDAFLFNPLVVTLGAAVAIIFGVRLLTARQITLAATRRERLFLWLLCGAVFFANWAYVIAYHVRDAAAVSLH